MTRSNFQLRGVDDPRLAVHATGALPVWLWSVDGTLLLWANPVGTRLFGADNGRALGARIFGPADPHRRLVAQLAGKLPPNGATRLERLRGFGARLGALVTCACTRLEFADGSSGVLIAAVEPIGRPMPLVDRLRSLVEGSDTPIAAFGRDGLFVGSSAAARTLLGFRNLTEAGLDQARADALQNGRSETPIGIGRMVLQRVGSGSDIGLVALLEPNEPDVPTAESAPVASDIPIDAPSETAPPESNVPDYEAIDTISEAPAEFTLLDETMAKPQADGAPAQPQDDVATPLPLPPRQHPLRFVWQLDGDSRFAVNSDAFIGLIGPRTAAHLGRPWAEIRAALALDPDDRFAQAITSRRTWSGVTLQWPADGASFRLPVEMSGLPVQDRDGNFILYRGFGVCRDLDGLDRLAALRQRDDAGEHPPRSLSADSTPRDATLTPDADRAPGTDTPDQQQQSDIIVETPRNVLPFRPVQDARSPALTPVENSAFNELARQLAERLESEAAGAAERLFAQAANDEKPDAPADDTPLAETASIDADASTDEPAVPSEPEAPKADWLAPLATPAKGDSARDRMLLDLMPVGVLIYRLDRLLYANAAFLQRMGHASLAALEEEGGLDALYVEEGAGGSSGTSETGAPITVATPYSAPTAARLHTIEWDGDQALALIFSGTADQASSVVAAASIAPEAHAPSDVGHANAEELGAILDTTAEGILMFDGAGRISACNRSAEALFGYDGDDLVRLNIAELFAPESNDAVRAYFDSVKSGSAESLLDHGLEALGRVREGGLFPLTMTIGRTQPEGPNYFAVFRDLSQARRIEVELDQVRKLADRAAGAKADVLARLSHEIRTPLNAIIGFAEVMIEERFGALGNERYADYLKDIRASGERVIGIVGDLLDLSRIETGKLDLAFTSQNLNELVEQCVAVMQPRANRERIIIRSSLAHALPSVTADAQALRQIVLNLIGTSIHLANAGGQVIVSTALSDFGEVVLRVRDTGHRLNDDEIAAALQPFSTPAPSDRSEASGVSLSLTKALVEANRAQFHIKSAPQSGTLIEVVFSHATAQA
ncbi:PAS domain-containing protein [Rhodopseudomonas sp. NSM]|uniref:PAS domain-containing protein n=1 Tax=Rhodopseudomonas sp. NSM TaxID=3457630 RepID=UPI0040364EF2